jgi:hypothetical protein
MNKIVYLVLVVIAISSCTVQQHAVNTSVEPFQNGGRLFGESTKGLKRGADYKVSSTLYVLGINLLSDKPTIEMANELGAEKYTIQTKATVLGWVCMYATGGIINSTKTTVFKRSE